MGDLDHEGAGFDSGIVSTVAGEPSFSFTTPNPYTSSSPDLKRRSWPFILNANPSPNYRILFLTHILLRNRFLHSSYRLYHLQTRKISNSGHRNTIYCLQLYTYSSTGRQTLFTGSRDKTVREWDLESRKVSRVISGIHTSSVLSICAHNGFLASSGSDGIVVVWDLESDKLVKVISDHTDSVLCVRFDDNRMVTCSKGRTRIRSRTLHILTCVDRTMRTYSFPDLEPQFVLRKHRAAVNAVSIYKNLIVSGSGDRSVRLWDLETGNVLRTYDSHHTRG